MLEQDAASPACADRALVESQLHRLCEVVQNKTICKGCSNYAGKPDTEPFKPLQSLEGDRLAAEQYQGYFKPKEHRFNTVRLVNERKGIKCIQNP